MKVTVQSKIAELEQRIAVLEAANRKRATTTPTTRTTTLTPEQDGHLASIWESFDEMFSHFGKIFRSQRGSGAAHE